MALTLLGYLHICYMRCISFQLFGNLISCDVTITFVICSAYIFDCSTISYLSILFKEQILLCYMHVCDMQCIYFQLFSNLISCDVSFLFFIYAVQYTVEYSTISYLSILFKTWKVLFYIHICDIQCIYFNSFYGAVLCWIKFFAPHTSLWNCSGLFSKNLLLKVHIAKARCAQCEDT